MGTRHVLPNHHASRGWRVVTDQGEAAHDDGQHTATQADAVERASAQVRRDGGGEVVIHGVRGNVQDKRTVGSEEEVNDHAGTGRPRRGP